MAPTFFLEGQFLLAMPGIGDPRFEHAVIAMCAHDAKGALGIELGTVLEGIGLHDLLAQLDIEVGLAPNVPVHHGGPVDPQRGFVLHTQDWQSDEGSLRVGARWALSSTLDVLRAIAAGTGPARFVVALGYAGWEAGQLEDEMRGTGWFVAEGDDALLFDTPALQRWTRGLALAGIDPSLLAPGAGTA